jgi:hypothetical protein
MSGAPMLKLVGTSTIPSRRLCRVPCGKPLAYRKACYPRGYASAFAPRSNSPGFRRSLGTILRFSVSQRLTAREAAKPPDDYIPAILLCKAKYR